ncbi:MAG: DUF6259 domain-containing protein, partial [Draconibacterium sp.]|nr:DUF6259 domain-containing protein [Draconibacterium sp.]
MNMNTVKLVILFCIISFLFQCCKQTAVNSIILENENIRLEFDKKTGTLIAFSDLSNSREIIEKSINKGLPWEVNFPGSSKIKKLTPSNFSYTKPDGNKLILIWKNFKELDNNSQITATIRLDKKESLSYWNITLDGLETTKFSSVTFPKIDGIKDFGKEKLAVPSHMGELISNPRKMLSGSSQKVKTKRWRYPSSPMSMQCLALYNPGTSGLYLSCNDSLAHIKEFSFTLDTLNTLVYRVKNFQTFEPGNESYRPPYSAIIGTFKGDWITAAEMYREWGTKQSWCRNSRFKKGKIPSWTKNTALWVWNRGRSENVLKPAMDLKQELGLPVSVWWHWWHGCSYDDGFPEYFPPREGKQSFIDAVKQAKKNDIHPIVYMNHYQWGNSTKSWENENAVYYAAKESDGSTNTHVYNKFTGNALTNMCITTQFWKDKYSSLCDSAVNIYQTSGVYMDQACRSRFCYDKNHKHPIGGGNYWVEHFGKLTDQIRAEVSNKNIILTGEDCGETFLPWLDLMMTL